MRIVMVHGAKHPDAVYPTRLFLLIESPTPVHAILYHDALT